MAYRLVIEPKQIQAQQIYLNLEQVHYLKRVVRLNQGDCFIAVDGEGNSWLASLDGNQAVIIESLLTPNTELPWSLTLVTAIVKGNGFDEIVRCCTELGVRVIIPTLTSRTLSQPSSHKVERWRKIAQEAVEQSERQIIPTILDPVPFTQVMGTLISREKSNYLCLTRQETPHLLTCLRESVGTEIVIATGPEGGWTATEIEEAIASGFQPVNLGNRILRAITAPIAATSLVAAVAEGSFKQ
ncbi:16S rRNA (uracil(1498)-N(3))-methyltransferase [Gloeocapsa sp. PCC 73106]|uniref:16S rRNA (uracil(1498)-N(3))-methyltransferase n=1 Tax=Gloeocapsa sp. PCC 73106 TaxID=102232 RepID=UPI00054F9FFD|nr:16S rRNA (uracil(1498)-N(3))-methyltransferase [Gloeocapsa sp. PCC 73106]